MTSYLFKYDLATAYFPTVSPHTAQKLFRRELRHNTALWQALLATGYRPSQKRLTPKQVQLIYTYIGEP